MLENNISFNLRSALNGRWSYSRRHRRSPNHTRNSFSRQMQVAIYQNAKKVFPKTKCFPINSADQQHSPLFRFAPIFFNHACVFCNLLWSSEPWTLYLDPCDPDRVMRGARCLLLIVANWYGLKVLVHDWQMIVLSFMSSRHRSARWDWVGEIKHHGGTGEQGKKMRLGAWECYW